MTKTTKTLLWVLGGTGVAYLLWMKFWPSANPTAVRAYGSTGTPARLLPSAVQANPSGYVVSGNIIQGTGTRRAQKWVWNGATWVWSPVIQGTGAKSAVM